MNRIFFFTIYALAGTLTLANLSKARATDAVSPATEALAGERRLLAPLASQGYSVDTVAGVGKALESERPDVQVVALTFVASRRIRALLPMTRRLLKSPDPEVRLGACKAVNSIDPEAKDWEEVCIELLKSDNLIDRIRAAALLASHGNGSGWPGVKSALFDKNSAVVFEAAQAAIPFQGVARESGKHIDVFDVCLNAFAKGDESVQSSLFVAVNTLAERRNIKRLKSVVPTAKNDYLKQNLQALIDRLQ